MGELRWKLWGGRKTRPAIIVSNDAANRVQVVPLTSKTEKLYPCEAKVTVASGESKAISDQIMIIAKERLTQRVEMLAPDDMHGVDFALRVQLGLSV